MILETIYCLGLKKNVSFFFEGFALILKSNTTKIALLKLF